MCCYPTAVVSPGILDCVLHHRDVRSQETLNPVHLKILGSLRNDDRARLRKRPLKSEFTLPQTLSSFKFHLSLSPPTPPLFAPTTKATNGSSPFTDDKFAYKLHKRKIRALPWLNNIFYEDVKCSSVVFFQ